MPKKFKVTIISKRPGQVIVEVKGKAKFRMTKRYREQYRRRFQKVRSQRMAATLFGLDRVYRRI
jgi:hypothetical protein